MHSVRKIGYGGERPSPPARPVPILFCIDAENDDFDPDRSNPKPWMLLEKCFVRLGAYREQLAKATGRDVALTWAVRVDPQLQVIYGDARWGLREYEPMWRELMAKGDDVGLHPHPQRWSAEYNGWVGGQIDRDWPVQVATDAFNAYCSVLGRSPQTFRFGNRFMSQELAAAVDKLGFRFDLTLEPGYPGRTGYLASHRVPGCCPDYFDLPRMPYRSVPGDYRTPDEKRTAGLWFIPMSSVPVSNAVPRSHDPFLRPVAPGLFPYVVLRPWMSPELFRRAVDHLMHELPRPYIAAAIRCDMIEMPEVWANLETLRTHPLAARFDFCTAEGLLGHLGCEAK